MTSIGLAPTAMRMPISRVRSITLTSMMFITPMPPTNSDTAATIASSVAIRWVESCWACANSAGLRIRKSSSSDASSLWRSRSSAGDRRDIVRWARSSLTIEISTWPPMYLARPFDSFCS